MKTECEKIESGLNDFLDGTLNAAQATELNTHLETCSACRREYLALKATRDLLRTMPVPSGDAARDRVMARFRHAVGSELPAPVPAPRFRWVPASALAFAVASLLFIGVRPHFAKKDAPPVEVADADANALPSLAELTEMQTLHNAQSLAVMGSVSNNAPEIAPLDAVETKGRK